MEEKILEQSFIIEPLKESIQKKKTLNINRTQYEQKISEARLHYLEIVKREIEINCMKLTWSAYETFSYEIVEKNSNEGKDYKLKCNFCSSEHSSNDEDKKFQNFFKHII